jgi:hypothetical protein
MKALHEREKRLAKVKKEQKALHKQQLANLPAPMLKQAKHKTNHLTDKDESLLKVAVGEQHKENKEALQAKKIDEAAEKVKEEQKKAAAAKAHAAHAKHAAAVKQHKNPSASKPSTKRCVASRQVKHTIRCLFPLLLLFHPVQTTFFSSSSSSFFFFFFFFLLLFLFLLFFHVLVFAVVVRFCCCHRCTTRG